MGYVVWDWNGTLLDDAACCMCVMNRMLTRRSLSPIPDLDAYRRIFTFPVRDYYALAGFDLAREPFEALAEEYMTDYRKSARSCGLIAGAVQTLERLRDMGAVQILVSASRQDDLERQLSEQGLTGRFQAVLGVSDQLGSGKAGVARRWLEARHVPAEDALFVGDSLHDREVALDIGCRCVLIANGHQSKSRLLAAGADVLDDIAQLPDYYRSFDEHRKASL